MFATNVIIMIVSGIEIAWLCALHSRGLVQWEPIWVIAISWLSYASDLVSPESEWVKPVMDNGEYVDWLKLVGWMATCPVLILFLVSLTTFGGREASVRVVPLLVANQMMFLMGATSGMCKSSSDARWWFYGASCCAGCYVFIASGVCFRSLYVFFGRSEAGANGRSLVLALSVAFFVGWVIFPIVWTFGHSGTGQLSDDAASVFQMVGDLLSKNTFIVLAVVLKVRFLTDDPKSLTTLLLGCMGDFADTWPKLLEQLGSHAGPAGEVSEERLDLVADGAAAVHGPGARHEAARKLITNHAVVLRDLTRADAPAPSSQPHLKRLPGQQRDVDLCLKEVARRLLGHPVRRRNNVQWRAQPCSPSQAQAWADTALFLSARLQVSEAECARTLGHEQRKPDMSPKAGAAFRAVLEEMAEEAAEAGADVPGAGKHAGHKQDASSAKSALLNKAGGSGSSTRGFRGDSPRRRPSLGNIAVDDIMGAAYDDGYGEGGGGGGGGGGRGSGGGGGMRIDSSWSLSRELAQSASTTEARAMAIVLQEVAELVVEHASTPEGRAVWAKPLDRVQRIVESDAGAQQQLAQQRQLQAAEAEVAAAVQKLNAARAAVHSPGGTARGGGATMPAPEPPTPVPGVMVTPFGGRRGSGSVGSVSIDMPPHRGGVSPDTAKFGV